MVRPDRHLTLFIPGLFGLPGAPHGAAAEGLPLTHLNYLLARGERFDVGLRDASVEGMLFELFGHARPSDSDWPAAALTRTIDERTPASGWQVRADPVHLRATLTGAVLVDPARLSVTAEEAGALAEEINSNFEGAGFRVAAPHPQRWYAALPENPGIRTSPLSAAVAKDVSEHLPAGPNARKWRSLLNEMQMLLHASVVNERRVAAAKLPVNSLWIWGGGALPAAFRGRWAHVWSGNPLAEALAHHSGVRFDVVPRNGLEWLQCAEQGGEHLLTLEDADSCARTADVEGWRGFAVGLESNWLGPLREALERRKLAGVTLLPGGRTGLRATPAGLRRWWQVFR